ncbi:MAG: hypothetical protein K2Z80_05580, partial [Xanthobacteraceae bacterium]|nr:hypothetical protein [Xanthobacteraceae bacterium]
QPETIPSCYRRSRRTEFQPLSGRHLLDTLLSGFTLPNTMTTVLQDWMKGRLSEADGLNGHVVEKARRMGMQTPVNAAVVELARRIEQGTLKPDPSNLGLLEQLIQQQRRENGQQ